MDYGRRLVVVSEAADPLAVTAYSLDDGSALGVFGGGRPGDGPGELTQVNATAVGPDGVFVSGPGRVLYWSWSGDLFHQWRLPVPGTLALCALNGRPAVPALRKGVVFRGEDGESVALGGEARARTPVSMDDVSSYFETLMTCTDSAAYVLYGMHHVLTEYKTGTTTFSWPTMVGLSS